MRDSTSHLYKDPPVSETKHALWSTNNTFRERERDSAIGNLRDQSTHLVGRHSPGGHLPQQDAVTPDVTLSAVAAELQALRRHPLHRKQTLPFW